MHQEKNIRANLAERMAADYMSLKGGSAVVDVGCGMGNVLLSIKERVVSAKVYGIDISEKMIALANEKSKTLGYDDIDFSVGSIKDVPVKADIVLSLGVLGYQENQKDFLTDLCSLVNDNGYLIFTTANGDSLLRALRRYLSKLHSFVMKRTKSKGVEFLTMKDREVNRILMQCGFELDKKIYITFGLGLFSSLIECSADRFLFKYLGDSSIGKYLSLTVIYAYKRK